MYRNDVELRFDPAARDVEIPFDGESAACYEMEIRPDAVEMEDGVVLALNREACLSFAKIFGQLAVADLPEGFALRLGWDETDAVGFRILLEKSGRLDATDDQTPGFDWS